MNTLTGEIVKFLQKLLIRVSFDKGTIRIGDTTLHENVNGYGILVAEAAIFTSLDTGNTSFTGPSASESWKPGFYLGIPIKDIQLSSGTVYIGKD